MSDWEIELPLVVYARDGSRPVRTRTLRIGERGIHTVFPASAVKWPQKSGPGRRSPARPAPKTPAESRRLMSGR